MIIRNKDGEIEIVERKKCKNDVIYYKKIYDIVTPKACIIKPSLKQTA